MTTTSLWHHAGARLGRTPLTGDATADVCVVGAGMCGILCAYTLAKAGLSVVLLEAREIGSGETGRTTAHLSNVIDDRFYVLEERHGVEASRANAGAHGAAIELLERISTEEKISCDFCRVNGYLFLPPGERLDILRREYAAAERAGMNCEMIERAPSWDSGPCLVFPNQGQFHPLRFLDGAARAAERLGVRIHTGTRVTAIEEKPLRVRTDRSFAVEARAIVLATNTPIVDKITIHSKQVPYRTYAFAARLPVGAVEKALYWDTSETPGDTGGAYHYVRLAETVSDPTGEREEVIIVGGSDHHTGEGEEVPERWDRLEAWARARWPMIGDVLYRWSGQVFEPADNMAYIGKNPIGPEGVFVATGDSGMGMTHSAIAALMMPSLVRGEAHEWSGVFDPSRKATHALGEFLGANAKVAGHFAEWLGAGTDIESIAPGEGAVVRRGVKMLAVFKDKGGGVHACSAVCPHAGCLVHWNGLEQMWECPCHGSRFEATGKVIGGPANKDLDPVQAPTEAEPTGG
ncbi:MAG TPA: FAD-dependent oxidoreductase [Phycisphaerales bacterium]|nr:FAD-dependent oxidoreductase [Phycisphaerales bacterium]